MQIRLRKAIIFGGFLSATLLMAGPLAMSKASDMGFQLGGKPNPVLAADALSMKDLREFSSFRNTTAQPSYWVFSATRVPFAVK
jgi:hypothetical protein